MSTQNDLFRLIKSMSKSEKRYFTLDAKKSGEKTSRYVQLFTLINSMDSYDENKLKKKFPKNLSADKIYLYEAILKSMRDYRSPNSMIAKMKEMILDSKYLYERTLYDLCKKRLSGAKFIAEELNDQATLLEINREERRLLRVGSVQKYQIGIDELIKEKRKVYDLLTEELRYLNLYDKLLSYTKAQFDFNDDEKVKQLDQEIAPLLTANVDNLSVHAQHRYYQCHVLYYRLLGNFNKAYHYSEKVMDWWDSHSKYKQEEFYRYIIDLSNLIQSCFSEGQYSYILPLLNKLDNEQARTALDKGILFQRSAISKLLYFFHKVDFEGAKELIPSIEEGLQKYQISTGSRIAITYNIIALFFILEEYDNCSVWSERIMKDIKTDLRQDVQRSVRLLYLIGKYEAGVPEAFDSSYRSVYRYFKNKQGLKSDDFEMQVIKHINSISSAAYNQQTERYKLFRDFLINIQQNPNERKAVGLDELIFWINSKIERKSILQLVKGQHQNNMTT